VDWKQDILDNQARFPGKWWILAAWWCVQGVLIWGATAVWSWQAGTVRGSSGWVFGLRDWEDLPRQAVRHDVLLSSLILAASIALVQWVVVLPVRRPEMQQGGKSLKVTIVLASGMIAALLVAAGFAVNALYELLSAQRMQYEVARMSTIAGGAFAWVGAGMLLWIWVRNARRSAPDVLARIVERIFRGTVIEVAAILPIDYMVRRKTDCYCGEGTFWALIVAGVVGTIAFGPLVWLPLIAKRRREWYGGHCPACGYDMRATMSAERCPECGCGWKAAVPQIPK
jgi:hypothetical protein